MPIKAVYDKLEDVPEQYRDLFGERGGKFELVGVEGVKTQADVDRLQTALAKERGDHKAAKDALSLWGNLNPDEVRPILDRVPELEAQVTAGGKGIDQTKLDELVEARIKSRLAPVERERDQYKQQVTELDGSVKQYRESDRRRTIREAVSDAARKAKIVDTALDDAITLGERVFDVGEDGKVRVKDDVGFTPGVEPSVWFTDIQDKRPHWWPASQGSGSSGSRGNHGYATNPFTHDNWNLTEQGKIMREKGPEVAGQMAKAAGTALGGPRPEKK